LKGGPLSAAVFDADADDDADADAVATSPRQICMNTSPPGGS